MGIALVSEYIAATGSVGTLPYASGIITVVPGDFLLFELGVATAGASYGTLTITDPGGNTWVKIATDIAGGGVNSRLTVYGCFVTTGFTGAITFAPSTGTTTTTRRVNLSRWTGVQAIGAFSSATIVAPGTISATVSATDPGSVIVSGMTYASSNLPSAGPGSGFVAMTPSGGTGYQGATAQAQISALGTYGASYTTDAARATMVTVELVPVPAAIGTLAGSGTLTGAGTPTPTGTTGLTGAGALAGAGMPRPTALLPFTGSGSLTITGTPVPSGTGGLSATGTLAGAGLPALTVQVALSGSGTLTATGQPAPTGTAALAGSGALTAAGSGITTGAAGLAGSGTLGAVGVARQLGTAALHGRGTLTVLTHSDQPTSSVTYCATVGERVWRETVGTGRRWAVRIGEHSCLCN